MDTTASNVARNAWCRPLVQVVASAWRILTDRRSAAAVWIVVILALVGLLPVELVLPPGTAVKVARALTTVLLSAGALGLWLMFAFNVLQQNAPQWARLVPGQVAALRNALYLGAGAITACAAALAAWAGWPWPVAALIVAPCCAAVACALRWPLLWVLIVVALATLSLQRQWGLLHVLALAWQQWPWAFAAMVLASSWLALRAVVFSGGAGHARAQLQLAATAATMRGDTIGTAQRQFSAGWLGPTRWGDWTYGAWMRHLLAQPRSSVGARLSLGTGPQAHLSGVFTNTLYVLALYLLLLMLCWLFPQWQALQVSHSGLLIGVAFSALLVPMQLPRVLWATRREQALLTLLPGAPAGAALNRWLAMRLTALDLGVVLGVMVAVAAFSRLGPVDPAFSRVEQMVLGALVLGLLLTLTLWRDWARARAPSGLLQWGVIGASLLIGALAAAWVHGYERPWYELAVWTALVALPLGLWRWSRLRRLPQAWPVGRIVEEPWRSPFDPVTPKGEGP